MRRDRRQAATPSPRSSTAGPRRWRSPTSTRAAPTPAMGRFSGKREWETLLSRLGSGRRDRRSELRPLRRQDPGRRSRICASTTRTCGRSTTSAATRSAAPLIALRAHDARRSREAHLADYREGLHDQPLQLSPAAGGGAARAAPHRSPDAAPRARDVIAMKRQLDVRDLHTVRLEPVGVEIRGRGRRDRSQRRLPPGHRAAARLQGRPVLGLQVQAARGRGRPAEILDLRAAATASARPGGILLCRSLRLQRHRGRAAELRRGAAVASRSRSRTSTAGSPKSRG